MAKEFVTGFNVEGEEKKYDYNALANKPTIPKDNSITYHMSLSGNTLSLTPSSGTADTVQIPIITRKGVDDSGTTISSLNDIPLNSLGRILLTESLYKEADSGWTGTGGMNVNFVCFGSDKSRSLIIQRVSTEEAFTNCMNNSSWVGWKKITLA